MSAGSIEDFIEQQKKSDIQLISQNKSLANVNSLIKEYNSGCKASRMSQADFAESVKSGNTILGNYLSGLNGANGTLKGYIAKLVGAKAATIGFKAAAVALNAAVSMGLSIALQALFTTLNKIIVTSEEARETAIKSAQSYKDVSKSAEEYIKQIKDLRSEIDQGNISEEEARQKRIELIEIQETLIKMFGDEASGIDLVTGKIEDQIDAIKRLSHEEWVAWDSQNQKAINDMRKAYSSDQKIGGTGYFGINPFNYYSVLESFEMMTEEQEERFSKYFEVYETGVLPKMGFKAESLTEAIEILTEYINVIKNSDQYINDPSRYTAFLEGVSNKLKEFTTDYEEYEEIYSTWIPGVLQERAYSDIWNSILSAQDEYTKALADGNNDAVLNAISEMEKAEQAFISANWDDELINSYVQDFISSFYKSANENRLRLELQIELDNKDGNFTKEIQNAINQFKNEAGKVDLDLITLTGKELDYGLGSSSEHEAYTTLAEKANEYGVEVEHLVQLLADLGYVQLESEEILEDTASAYDEAISKYQQAVDLIHKATSEQDSTNAVSLETYNALLKINEDYADLFEFTANGIQLQTDALVKNIDALEQTTAAELAAAGATGTEIASIFAATSALKKYGATATASLDDISDLVDMQKELEEGTEYSTVQMLDLIEQYPSLAGSIIETANGYKIETEAVKDLVDEKVKLYKQNKLLETQSSKDALISQSGRSVVAKNVEKIFDQYYSDNGKHIGSLEDYISKRSDMFSGSSIETDFKDKEIAYVEKLIKFYATDNLLTGISNNETKDGITPSSSSSDAETEFEKAYNLHQHYLAMDQESVEDYVDWLSLAYKQAVADGSLSLEDAYQYEEEVYEKRKELFADYISDTEHQISILENDPITDNSDKITALYQELQQKVHAQAEKYRAMGLDENDEAIQELQNQWWSYADAISQIREEAFSKNINDLNYGIETLKLNEGDSSEILSTYDDILKAIRSEIEYYTSLGYSESSEIIRDLTGQLNDTKEEIIDYINEVVEEANDILDGFEEAYSTITDAAKEYASTGALSADSLQSILELSPKYLSFLNDENGQLVLNKQALQDIIAAKTEEMAVENALAYSRQVLRAAQENDINSLITLTDVTKAVSNATWDMAYATLSLAKAIGTANGMDSGYFDSAADYVSKMQSLSRTAVSTISTYFSTLEEGYVSHADGLQTILDLTQDMIKWENEQLIDALEKEKEDYADIIDQKKELIQLAKKQDDREKSVAEKLEKMAKLQGQIAQLSLDDSREAQAQRRSLEEELADLQKELADEQSDYSFEVQEEALDKELEAFEKSKDDEIEALEDMLSSAEKLYQAAIDRIGNGWDELYSDLLAWNYEYGSTLEADLTAAWNSATEAVKRYGSFVEAVEGVKGDSILGDASVPMDDTYRGGKNTSSESAYSIIDRMKKNSLDWFTASDDERKAIQADQQRLADEYEEIFGQKLTSKNGSWYLPGEDNPIYELTQEEVGKAIVDQMEKNAKAWHTADPVEQQMLAEENIRLKKILEDYLGVKITKTSGGVWMLGNKNLFDVYHTGGIVGGNETLKDKEILAKLEEGELVLDQSKKDVLYAKLASQPLELMSEKFFRDRNIDMNAVNRLAAESNSFFSAFRQQNDIQKLIQSISSGGSILREQKVEIGDIYAPINVVKELNDEEIKKHAKMIGELSAEYIQEGFTKRGIKRNTSRF